MNGDVLPSGQLAQQALSGDRSAWVASGVWTLRRAALLWLGMTLAGSRKGTVKKALTGSSAIQALVLAYVAIQGDPKMPSGEAAIDADLPAILTTFAARTGVLALALHTTGQGEDLWRDSLAGAAAIEVSVLAWGAQKRQQAKALPEYIVG